MTDLIGQNADYLVHTISIHLRTRHLPEQQQQQSQAVQVLQSVVTHGDEGVCQLVRDVLDELLLSLDLRQLEAGLVWEGLESLAQNCARWVDQRPRNDGGVVVQHKEEGVEENKKMEADQEEDRGRRKDVGIETIAEFFRNYHKEKDKGLEEEEGEGEDGEDSEGLYSQDKPLPCCEGVCVDVLRRSAHHMSHPAPAVRLRVLEAVQHCLRVLQHHKVD